MAAAAWPHGLDTRLAAQHCSVAEPFFTPAERGEGATLSVRTPLSMSICMGQLLLVRDDGSTSCMVVRDVQVQETDAANQGCYTPSNSLGCTYACACWSDTIEQYVR